MKKFLSSMFRKAPVALDSNPFPSSHDHDELGRVEDYLNSYSDIDTARYYERRRWRA
jgi:hypothetical protein